MVCKLIALLGILSAATCCLHAGALPAGSTHTRDFWREIAKNHYAVRVGQPVFPLMQELSGYQHLFIWSCLSTIPACAMAAPVKIDPEFGKK